MVIIIRTNITGRIVNKSEESLDCSSRRRYLFARVRSQRTHVQIRIVTELTAHGRLVRRGCEGAVQRGGVARITRLKKHSRLSPLLSFTGLAELKKVRRGGGFEAVVLDRRVVHTVSVCCMHLTHARQTKSK